MNLIMGILDAAIIVGLLYWNSRQAEQIKKLKALLHQVRERRKVERAQKIKL